MDIRKVWIFKISETVLPLTTTRILPTLLVAVTNVRCCDQQDFFLKNAERKRKFWSFVENKVEKVSLGSNQISPSQSLLFRAFLTKFSSLILSLILNKLMSTFIYLLRWKNDFPHQIIMKRFIFHHRFLVFFESCLAANWQCSRRSNRFCANIL